VPVTFHWPIALLALLVVPLALAVRVALRRRRARYAVRFTNVDVLETVLVRSSEWRRRTTLAIFLLALATTVVAFARPQVERSVPDERATIVLVLDTSGSMQADDVDPTRLGAAQEAVRTFLEKLPAQVRVALVSFSSVPQLVAPPTHDRELVRSALSYLFPASGTAIGDAIGRGIEVVNDAVGKGAGDSKKDAPAAMVLLSDGAQRDGTLQPVEAARKAREAGIRIYTVALGTPNGVVKFDRGGFIRIVPVPPEPIVLHDIAETTRGAAYTAENAEELSGVYRSLGSHLGRKKQPEEVTYAFVAAAAGLLLLSGIASALWAPKIP